MSRKKKKPRRPPKKKPKPTPDADETEPDVDDEMEPSETPITSSGPLTSMRDMISGGGEEGSNFFSKRRSLGEWALWFAGLVAIYFIVQKLIG